MKSPPVPSVPMRSDRASGTHPARDAHWLLAGVLAWLASPLLVVLTGNGEPPTTFGRLALAGLLVALLLTAIGLLLAAGSGSTRLGGVGLAGSLAMSAVALGCTVAAATERATGSATWGIAFGGGTASAAVAVWLIFGMLVSK